MLSVLVEEEHITFIRKDPSVILGDLFEVDRNSGKSFGEALTRLLEGAFISRVPHLTNSAMSQDIDALIEAQVGPGRALQHLLSQV